MMGAYQEALARPVFFTAIIKILTGRIYPGPESLGIRAFAAGTCSLVSFRKWDIFTSIFNKKSTALYKATDYPPPADNLPPLTSDTISPGTVCRCGKRSVRGEVGSSIMIAFASIISALAISIICCWPTEQAPAGWSWRKRKRQLLHLFI